jgi:hypothetical protein
VNAEQASKRDVKAKELSVAPEQKVNGNNGGTNTGSPHASQLIKALKSVTNRRSQNEPNN